jgi:hypothetical protein
MDFPGQERVQNLGLGQIINNKAQEEKELEII